MGAERAGVTRLLAELRSAGQKNEKTECHFMTGKDGKQILQEVRVKGDTRKIVMEGSGI